MACEPIGELLPASWKGFDFHIDKVVRSGGRRLAKHEYPNSERWFVEDLGVKTPTINVTAYFAWDKDSESVYADSRDFEDLCSEGGNGALKLPPDIDIQAHCESFERAFEKDRQGYIAYDLEFVEDDVDFEGAPFAIPTPGLAIRDVAQALLDAAGAIIDFGANFFAVIDFVLDVQGLIGDVVGVALAVIDTAFSIAGPILDVVGDVAVLFDVAVDAIAVFESVSTANAPAAFETMVTAFVDYASLCVASVENPRAFAESMQASVLQIAVPPAPLGRAVYVERTTDTVYSLAYTSTMQQAAAFSSVLTGIVMAQAYADAEYPTREEAQLARGKMVSTINFVMQNLTADAPAVAQLVQARNQAAAAISSKIADLRPIQTVAFNTPITALYAAWRMYKDASRAQELVDLNGAPHPMFMPSTMEAFAADMPATTRGSRLFNSNRNGASPVNARSTRLARQR